MAGLTAEQIFTRGGIKMDEQKLEMYRHLNKYVKKGQILFTGSSLMEQFPINEILTNHGIDMAIYNRGISGYTIPEMLQSMEEQIFGTEPSVIFINIGTNDISREDETMDALREDYRCVLSKIKERLPDTKVYMMAYYPVNTQVAEKVKAWPEAPLAARLRSERLADANEVVRGLAGEFGYEYIEVNDGLTDENGRLRSDLTIDGIHMWPDAYEIIFGNLRRYLTER